MSVMGVIGRKGSGKTLYMSKVGLKAIKKNRKVYSNYGLIGSWSLLEPVDMLGVEQGSLILLDEANSYFDSYDHVKFPSKIKWLLQQERKIGIDLIWSSQYLAAIDKRFRMLSDYVVLMRKISFKFFYGRYFRPSDFNDDCIPKEKHKPYKRTAFFLSNKLISSYNTNHLINRDQELIEARKKLRMKSFLFKETLE